MSEAFDAGEPWAGSDVKPRLHGTAIMHWEGENVFIRLVEVEDASPAIWQP
jgi:hypothetical protein